MTWRRLLPLLALLVMPASVRADVAFSVQQDVSALFSASAPPSPFYLGFYLNSGDAGLYDNSVKLFDFTSKNVSLIGAPVVQKGNASGQLLGFVNPLILQEGTSSTLGDYTFVYQQISVDAANAYFGFSVNVTQSFVGDPKLFSPDMFTYQLLYDHDGLGGTLPVPIDTTLIPGNRDYIQYSFSPANNTYLDVKTGATQPGNPYPILDGVGAAFVIPEPTTFAVWGLMLGSVGFYLRNRKLVQVSSLGPKSEEAVA